MLMAGPVGGMGVGMGNGGGGGGGMQVNPNWVGAAALFMPQLLTGNGVNNAGGSAQNPVGNRVMGGLGAATPQSTAGRGQVAGLTAPMDGKRASLVLPPALVRPTPAVVDPAIADARLLAHQRDQAGQGAPSAQLALARRYATGNGVEANPAIARVWLEAAARNGSEEAKAELSTAHVLKPDSAGRASESPGTTVF
jgi:TPR repeat protein